MLLLRLKFFCLLQKNIIVVFYYHTFHYVEKTASASVVFKQTIDSLMM